MNGARDIARRLRNRLVRRGIHLPRVLLLLIVRTVLDILTETPQKSAYVTLVEHRKQLPDERLDRVAEILSERYGLRRLREGHLAVRFIRSKPATNAELGILYELKMRAHAARDVDMVAVLERAIYALSG